MKTIFLTLSILTSSLSFAESFTGMATYSKTAEYNQQVSFNNLERKGVMHEAILEATMECNEAGFRDCVYVSSSIVKGCGSSYWKSKCTAKALVISVN